jgi:hypothetical protein
LIFVAVAAADAPGTKQATVLANEQPAHAVAVHKPLYSLFEKPLIKYMFVATTAAPSVFVVVTENPFPEVNAAADEMRVVCPTHAAHVNVIDWDADVDTAHWPLYPPRPDTVMAVPAGSTAPFACPQPAVPHETTNVPDADATPVVAIDITWSVPGPDVATDVEMQSVHFSVTVFGVALNTGQLPSYDGELPVAPDSATMLPTGNVAPHVLVVPHVTVMKPEIDVKPAAGMEANEASEIEPKGDTAVAVTDVPA